MEEAVDDGREVDTDAAREPEPEDADHDEAPAASCDGGVIRIGP